MVTWWWDILGWAELAFVACFFVTESLRLAFRKHVTRAERVAQVIPPEKFFPQVAVPLVTAVAGILVAIGAIWSTSNNGVQAYLGLLTIMFSLVWLVRYLVRFAAGSYPRPVARARVRRVLAEAGERLESGTSLSQDEAVRLRARLERMRQLGDRLIERAGSGGSDGAGDAGPGRAGGERWREAARNEPRWLLCAVVAAIVLPVTGAVAAVVRIAEGRPLAGVASALGVCLALAAATVAASMMRRMRCRRDMRDLGAEVKSRSQVLLGRLAEVTPVPFPPPSQPPRTSSLRVLWRRLVRNPRL